MIKETSTTSIDSYCLYLNYLKRYNQGSPVDFSSLLYKFNRIYIVIFGAYICNVDPMGRYKGQHHQTEDDTQDEFGAQEIVSRSALSSCPHCPSGETIRQLFKDLIVSTRRLLIPSTLPRSAWRRQLKAGWIPYAFLAFYLMLDFVVLADVFYLYVHETSRLRLERVRDLITLVGPQGRIVFDDAIADARVFVGTQMRLGDFEQILARRVNETRHTLSYLGDKFIQLGIINIVIYLSVPVFGFLSYITYQVLYLWINEPDFQFQRYLIDHEKEQRLVDNLCESVVHKYLESYRTFKHYSKRRESMQYIDMQPLMCPVTQVSYAYLCRQYFEVADTGTDTRRMQHETRQNSKSLTDLSTASLGPPPGSTSAVSDADDHTHRLIMQMYTAGALRPLNGSNWWIRRQNLIQVAIEFSVATYSALFNVCAAYWVYKNSLVNVDLSETCVVTLVFANTGIIVYYFIAFFLPCLDQLMQVNHLLRLINDCISLNERQLHLYLRGPVASEHCDDPKVNKIYVGQVNGMRQQTMNMIVDRMNSNLLFVVLSYKIFVAQFKPFKRALRGVVPLAFSMAFVVPVLARIHVPYLAPESQTLARLLQLLISLSVLIPIDIFCLPMCNAHSRCEGQLYKAMSSLMAHITEVRLHAAGEKGEKGFYNEHAVSTLIKELSHPKLMHEQFVVQSLGLGGTFATLLKLHFWWGFVALSILIDSRQSYHNEFLTVFFSDPLGVWCFHLI